MTAEDRVNINLATSLRERLNRVVNRLQELALIEGTAAPTRMDLIVQLLEAGVHAADELRAQGHTPPAVQHGYAEPTVTVPVPRALHQRLQRECQQRTNELPPDQRYTVPLLHLVNWLLAPAVEQWEQRLTLEPGGAHDRRSHRLSEPTSPRDDAQSAL